MPEDRLASALAAGRTRADELQAGAALIAGLIDRLNDLLAGLAAAPELAGQLHHVDLRPAFRNTVRGGLYRQDWRDELHATPAAFQDAARRIAAAIQALP